MSILYAGRVGPHQFFPPKNYGLSPLDAEIKDKNGNLIHGWYFPSRIGPARGTLIHFHGNAENLTSHYTMMIWLVDQGWNYFIFDYPGYGLSTGEPEARTTVDAGLAVVEWIHDHVDNGPLVIYGQSLGGAVAQRVIAELDGRIPICDLILDSTFYSYRSVARRKFSTRWWLWPLQPLAWLLMSDKAGPPKPENLPHSNVLVIVGNKDRVVEPENGEELYRRLNPPKEIWRIEEGVHSGTFHINRGEYRTRLINRINRTCWRGEEIISSLRPPI